MVGAYRLEVCEKTYKEVRALVYMLRNEKEMPPIYRIERSFSDAFGCEWDSLIEKIDERLVNNVEEQSDVKNGILSW
ncbi:hypothetical protein Tco_0717740 [Tanacetum coccineum]